MAYKLAPCGGIKLDETNFTVDEDGVIKVTGDGGSGTSDYTSLSGKPQINGHELTSGDNSLESLGITKDGLGIEDYVLPEAKPSSIGGVKQATLVAEAVGENVTQAEFKALLDALKAAGIMANE